jgi:hypothetical protein
MKEETYELVGKIRKILTWAMWLWTVLMLGLVGYADLILRSNPDLFSLALVWLIPLGVVALIRYLLPSTSYSKTVNGRPIHVEKDPGGKALSTPLGTLNLGSELCPQFTANVLLAIMDSKREEPLVCFTWPPNGVYLYSFQAGKEKESFIDYRGIENDTGRNGWTRALIPLQGAIEKMKVNSGLDYTLIFCRKEDPGTPVLIFGGSFDASFLQALEDLQKFIG